jgi:hypothetical protein
MRKGNFMEKQKNLIKLSNLLLDSLYELKKAKLRQVQTVMEDFCIRCSDATKDSHLFHAAIEREWLTGAENILSRMDRNLNDFSYNLQRFKELVKSDEMVLPNLSDIFAELLQIQQEFGELKFDLKERTISVTTEPITLDNISFGPFEVKLFIDQISKLYSDAPYKVIALKPNPAGTDDSITHPHVSSEKLCEGDGHVSIRKAIEQGRLCDFFSMTINILQTYNPDSPYISLDDWEGISCYDCGSTMAEDDRYYCESCDRDYCSQCSTCCQRCDTTICLGCAYECPGCNEPVCQSCTAKCKECEDTYCKDCLTEEGLCYDCEEQRKESENEEQEQLSEEPKADAPVQPDSVGKTTILS